MSSLTTTTDEVNYLHLLAKGFPTLIHVMRTVDGALDWVKEGRHPDLVPEAEESMHAWLRIQSSRPYSEDVSHPLTVLYSPRNSYLPTGRVEIRIQGILENGNLHRSGEYSGYVPLNTQEISILTMVQTGRFLRNGKDTMAPTWV